MFVSLLDLMRQSGQFLPVPTGPVGTHMEITDQGNHLRFEARLRGIDPRSVQIQLTESVLALSGYGTREERTEGPTFTQVSSGMSSFYRELPLPAPVNPRGATSEWLPDGTLIITMPKQ